MLCRTHQTAVFTAAVKSDCDTTETHQQGAVTSIRHGTFFLRKKKTNLKLGFDCFYRRNVFCLIFVMRAIYSDMKWYWTVSTFGFSAMCALFCRPVDQSTSVNKGFRGEDVRLCWSYCTLSSVGIP